MTEQLDSIDEVLRFLLTTHGVETPDADAMAHAASYLQFNRPTGSIIIYETGHPTRGTSKYYGADCLDEDDWITVEVISVPDRIKAMKALRTMDPNLTMDQARQCIEKLPFCFLDVRFYNISKQQYVEKLKKLEENEMIIRVTIRNYRRHELHGPIVG